MTFDAANQAGWLARKEAKHKKASTMSELDLFCDEENGNINSKQQWLDKLQKTLADGDALRANQLFALLKNQGELSLDNGNWRMHHVAAVNVPWEMPMPFLQNLMQERQDEEDEERAKGYEPTHAAPSSRTAARKQASSWKKTVTDGDYCSQGEYTKDEYRVPLWDGGDVTAPWVFIGSRYGAKGFLGIIIAEGFWSDNALKMMQSKGEEVDWLPVSKDSFGIWLEAGGLDRLVVSNLPPSPDDFSLIQSEPDEAESTQEPEEEKVLVPEEPTDPYAKVKPTVTEIPVENDFQSAVMYPKEAARSPQDKDSIRLASLLAGKVQQGGLTTGVAHSLNTVPKVASFDARVIDAALTLGESPLSLISKAASANYYGLNAEKYKSAVVNRVELGTLTIQPDFVKASCTKTAAWLNAKKADRFFTVSRIAACGGCQNCKTERTGTFCTLHGKPLVTADAKTLYKVANAVWGHQAAEETPTMSAVRKRVLAYWQSKTFQVPEHMEIPLPEKKASAADLNRWDQLTQKEDVTEDPRTWTLTRLLAGDPQHKIAAALNLKSASFRNEATAILKSRLGMVGVLTKQPNMMGSCKETFTHLKKAGAVMPLSVKRIANCEECSARREAHCGLYGRPIVASTKDVLNVVSETLKQSVNVKDLAKALGLPEDHPTFQRFETQIPEKELPKWNAQEPTSDLGMRAVLSLTDDVKEFPYTAEQIVKKAFNSRLNPAQILERAEKRAFYGLKKAAFQTAMKNLAPLYGFIAVDPDHHQGSCQATKKKFGKVTALAVLKTAKCEKCTCYTAGNFCTMFGKPVTTPDATEQHVQLIQEVGGHKAYRQHQAAAGVQLAPEVQVSPNDLAPVECKIEGFELDWKTPLMDEFSTISSFVKSSK
jgi:Zn-finger nucleic acid-binding protein